MINIELTEAQAEIISGVLTLWRERTDTDLYNYRDFERSSLRSWREEIQTAEAELTSIDAILAQLPKNEDRLEKGLYVDRCDDSHI